MDKAPAVIFDIDGTLADLSHRLHHVIGRPRNYNAFFEAVGEDEPIQDIIALNSIVAESPISEITILLVSGRPERVRKATEAWLQKHKVAYDELYMRPDGDYRKDTLIKSQILDKIQEEYDVLFVVEDRPSVVAMWRERGLTCLQCGDWHEVPDGPLPPVVQQGLLSLIIGPSGAGKSAWLKSDAAKAYGIEVEHVLSSDAIRRDLGKDFNGSGQSTNNAVFKALHTVAQCRIKCGLSCLVDATNIKRQDRLEIVYLANGGCVKYYVLDRPLEEKYKTGEWRNKLNFDLVKKHHDTFQAQLKDILDGDGQENVEVVDLRHLLAV